MDWLADWTGALQREARFRPPVWLRGPHLQTLAASQARRRWPRGVARRWESVALPDGARVRVLKIEVRDAAPTLVLLHGMGGSTDSGYIRGLSEKAFRAGWNVFVANLYNVNPALERPRIFHAGCSGDFREILLRSGVLRGPVVLLGVSLGGNVLLKMLGEWAADVPRSIRGAAALSPLVDLEASWPLLDRRASWIYRRHFVDRLKTLVRRHADQLEGFVDLDRLASVRTIRRYDEVVTAPLGGFATVSDYYREASARPWLGRIGVATLVLHAADDPLLPAAPWQDDAVRGHPLLAISVQRRGGHAGFLQRRHPADPDRWWAENRMIDFLGRALGG